MPGARQPFSKAMQAMTNKNTALHSCHEFQVHAISSKTNTRQKQASQINELIFTMASEPFSFTPLRSFKEMKAIGKVQDGQALVPALISVVELLKSKHNTDYYCQAIAHLELMGFGAFLTFLATDLPVGCMYALPEIRFLSTPKYETLHRLMQYLLMKVFRPSCFDGNSGLKQEMTRKAHEILMEVRPSYAINSPDVTPFLTKSWDDNWDNEV